jgi:hypothetical protein
MPRKMIRLARGAKCGFFGRSRLLSAAPSDHLAAGLGCGQGRLRCQPGKGHVAETCGQRLEHLATRVNSGNDSVATLRIMYFVHNNGFVFCGFDSLEVTKFSAAKQRLSEQRQSAFLRRGRFSGNA